MPHHLTEINLHGLTLEVAWNYMGPSRGSRDSMGVPEEPDYPEECEVVEILHHGEEILCLMADDKIAQARDAVLKERR